MPAPTVLGISPVEFPYTRGKRHRLKSTALPVELALRGPHILSQDHDLTKRLARYLLGLVTTSVREHSWVVRVSLPRALRQSQGGQKVLCLDDSVPAKD